jgi:hypothetical protein
LLKKPSDFQIFPSKNYKKTYPFFAVQEHPGVPGGGSHGRTLREPIREGQLLREPAPCGGRVPDAGMDFGMTRSRFFTNGRDGNRKI